MKRIAITLLSLILASLCLTAQEAKNEARTEKSKEAFVRVKPDQKVVVIINGKKYDSEILDLIDVEKIESIDIIKGENARERYNEENVIIITPKTETITPKTEVKEKEKTGLTIRGNGPDKLYDTTPLIFIDGKESTKEDLENLSPENIFSVNIIKGEEARKKFNSENGVIEVKTKKKE